ncbi:hypothetical protein D3C84_853320 [compost metagenome]
MERFDLQSINHIVKQADEIQRFAIENYKSDSTLFNMIGNLSRVIGMFGYVIEENIKDQKTCANPQEYLHEKMSRAYTSMREYKFRQLR